MRLLSIPFRLQPNGSVATVEQDTPEAAAEQIGALVLTRAGERPLQPGFGIPDPAFDGVEPVAVAAGVAEYGPPVDVVGVDVEALGDAEAIVRVRFD